VRDAAADGAGDHASAIDAPPDHASAIDAPSDHVSAIDAPSDRPPADAAGLDAGAKDAGAKDAGSSVDAATDAGRPADARPTDAGARDAGQTTGADAGGKDAGGPPACVGFAAQASAWPLPGGAASSFPQTELEETLGCNASGQFSWSTFDIDGDGLPDLVVTQKCFDPALGVSRWSVYKNTGAGFAATPTAWSLPTGSAPSFPFRELPATTCDASTQFSWSTFDIDGDRLPDLVVTQRCFDAALGVSQWNVYKNTGSGFAATPTTWSLPAGSAPEFPFRELDDSLSCDASTQFSWSTFDIDGDGLPDLVVTQKCFDTALGVTRWNVYKNTGTGFAATPATWSLPTGSASSFGFKDHSQTGSCDASTEFSWSTFDIDGDGLPDLVVTQKCFDAALGVTRWNVYKNTGAGFAATPVTWSLPTGSASSFPFKDHAVTGGCSSSTQFAWSTFDIDGDARPDLVVTQKCFDAALGVTRWYVYPGGPSGFAPTPTCFGLPPAYPAISFPSFTTGSCSSSAQYSWSTLDMNRDGKPDLLVTTRCFDPALGVSQWNLHPNQR
jgi:hypothetical protein